MTLRGERLLRLGARVVLAAGAWLVVHDRALGFAVETFVNGLTGPGATPQHWFAWRYLGIIYDGLLLPVGLGWAAIAVARALARLTASADGADPFDRLRAYTRAHPPVMTILTCMPAFAWTAWHAGPWTDVNHWDLREGQTLGTIVLRAVVPAVLSFLAGTGLARAALRALVAPPTSAPGEAPIRRSDGLDADGFSFDAIAITRRTVGAVAAMLLLTTLMVVTASSPWAVRVVPEALMTAMLGAYVTTALGGAYFFARASRIAIGLDGVLVGGSTKERFVAFRDVDHVRVVADIIELRSPERALLRLQLHGKDAKRRDAIVPRLEAAIAEARTLRTDPTAAFVESASVDDLARAAGGASSYRTAAPSRDRLWEVFESAVLAPESRRAAGEALASGIEEGERSRFRIAAERIAEPETRAHLGELLDDEPRAPRKMRMRA